MTFTVLSNPNHFVTLCGDFPDKSASLLVFHAEVLSPEC